MKKKMLILIMAATLAMAGCGAPKNESDAAILATTEVSTEDTETQEKTEISSTEISATEENTKEADTENASTHASETDEKTATKETTTDAVTDAVSKDESENKEGKENVDTSAVEKTSGTDKSAETEKNSDTDKTTEVEKKSEADKTTETKKTSETAQAQPAPQKADYGRILFIGDSRSVDMFSADQSGIFGEVHDGITVYAEDARNYTFLIETIGQYDTANFDTLVSWMGCNDYGDFGSYQPHYEGLLREGKNIVLCTVGPTLDTALANDFDRTHYINDLQIAYNNSLIAWANVNGVKVIDLYSYISNSSDISIASEDGIHYQPKPTSAIWGRILSQLQ